MTNEFRFLASVYHDDGETDLVVLSIRLAPRAVRCTRASRIEGHWTPNLLRHTAASLMADAGLPIEQVADQLGHRDLRMLQKHYRHRIKPTVGGAHIVNNLLNDTKPR